MGIRSDYEKDRKSSTDAEATALLRLQSKTIKAPKNKTTSNGAVGKAVAGRRVGGATKTKGGAN